VPRSEKSDCLDKQPTLCKPYEIATNHPSSHPSNPGLIQLRPSKEFFNDDIHRSKASAFTFNWNCHRIDHWNLQGLREARTTMRVP